MGIWQQVEFLVASLRSMASHNVYYVKLTMLLCGGNSIAGNLFEPTILANVPNDALGSGGLLRLISCRA